MTMATAPSLRSLKARFDAFLTEKYPFAATLAAQAFRRSCQAPTVAAKARDGLTDDFFAALSSTFETSLRSSISVSRSKGTTSTAASRSQQETTPGVSLQERKTQAEQELERSCLDFFEREKVRLSFSTQEKRELLRGMMLTRATDNRLKGFFTGCEVRHESTSFQGKGFRSLGQEAIYAATLRLRRGDRFVSQEGDWTGDVVAPLIRDAGLALGMHPEAETVRMILNAQMGKAGPPMNGKDLHIGDFRRGILPPAAPLSISSLTASGVAFAMHREGKGRVALAMIGEGGSSLGEWHEAINLSAARQLPIVFCIQNNQTALSTSVPEQSSVRTFADKAVGYGIPGLSIDGTDPEEVAATFTWAVERARRGLGPTLIETISMRMCGHAHHDDMLFLGKDPVPGWQYSELFAGGYADPDAYEFWAKRDPIHCYAEQLESEGILAAGELDNWKAELDALVEKEAQAVVESPWPSPSEAGQGVFSDQIPAQYQEALANRSPLAYSPSPELPPLEPGSPFTPKGRTFLDAVMMGVGDALAADPRVFVYGQDVGAPYGNAFLLLRPLLGQFGDRILNSTLAEGGILGVCVGAALAGQRPIGEIQFNDFVATGFNQLVNNAAKIHYRWGESVPMVVRMPWGGLRHAGPYHSQNTEAWFFRTPGLKIVAPSTPEDARALMAAAVADPDPVLFYEHIALYRDPRIKQALGKLPPSPAMLGKAALRRAGKDLAIISYGAYVHHALRVADRLAKQSIEASVLDLRSLVPLDRDALLAVTRHCGRVLICHEDSRTGGLGESLAAFIQEQAFEFLDAPIRIVGALDTPVPYSPALEGEFLASEEQIEAAAKLLVEY